MPPRAKFTKQEVVQKAFEIVKRKGVARLTARSLGDALGSSSRPIFTVFGNMDEVREEVISEARKLYTEYVDEGLNEVIAFKGVGEAYLKFAVEEPELFRLLFMSKYKDVPELNSVLNVIEVNYGRIVNSVMTAYGLNESTAEKLYRHMWIYTHGIAVLLVTGTCNFSFEETSEMLTDVCKGLLIKIKLEIKL